MNWTEKIYLLTLLLGFLNVFGSDAIECYDCNSENDPRCGDPFDPYPIGRINCSYRQAPEHIADAKPILCRKNVQTIYGKTRVYRGCGFLEDKDLDDRFCLHRSGTHDVFVRYCSCTTDFCNNSPRLFHYSVLAILIVLLIITRPPWLRF